MKFLFFFVLYFIFCLSIEKIVSLLFLKGLEAWIPHSLLQVSRATCTRSKPRSPLSTFPRKGEPGKFTGRMRARRSGNFLAAKRNIGTPWFRGGKKVTLRKAQAVPSLKKSSRYTDEMVAGYRVGKKEWKTRNETQKRWRKKEHGTERNGRVSELFKTSGN